MRREPHLPLISQWLDHRLPLPLPALWLLKWRMGSGLCSPLLHLLLVIQNCHILFAASPLPSVCSYDLIILHEFFIVPSLYH